MIAFIKPAWLACKEFFTGEKVRKIWEFAKSFFDSKPCDPNAPAAAPSDSPKILSIFEDSTGGYSAMRFTLIFVIVCVMHFWSLEAIMNLRQSKPLPDIPQNVVFLILGLSGSKVVQRFCEK